MSRVYACLAILVLFVGKVAVAAEPAVDILCVPPQNSIHGGFTVSGVRTGNKTYTLKITQEGGWVEKTIRFNGAAYLIRQKVNESCSVRMVDDLENSKIVVEMKENGIDAVIKMNGASLSPAYVINQLNCQVSERFLSDIPQCE